jgi:outer membrane protein assembly factor BamB
VVRDRPDSELSPAFLSLKAAVALWRAGRHAEFEQQKSELASRYGDEKVALGGATALASELLRRWIALEPAQAGPADSNTRALDLSRPVEPLWQVRFGDSVKAGMVPVELLQWESHPLSVAVPAAAIGRGALFVNELGFVFGVDLTSGKLFWRTEPLHHLKLQSMQDHTRAVDPSRFAVVAAGDYVCTLARDLKDGNMMAAYTLACRRSEGGELIWQSTELPDYSQLDLNGPPIVAEGKLFVPAKTHANQPMQQRQPQQFVLAIQPHDGKVLWKTEVGTYREGPRYYFYSRLEQEPQPQLLYRGGAIYVDTHQGILARLDADSGALLWGYGYQTERYQSSYRFFYYDMQSEPMALGGPPLVMEDSFLVKGMKSSRISAVEPDRMKTLWDRPVAKSTRLLGVGRRAVFLGGDEISALDLKTRALLWATRVPGASLQARVLVQPDGLWQLTSRGIYEIDPDTGAVRRIFRGADLGSIGGDLLLTDQLLLAVSNRTITAYPRGPEKEKPSDE